MDKIPRDPEVFLANALAFPSAYPMFIAMNERFFSAFIDSAKPRVLES